MAHTEQRTTPETRAELWRRYEASLLDIEATWPWVYALSDAATALLADADALAGALAEVAVLRTALASIRDQAASSRVEWLHLPGIIEQIRQRAGVALAPQSGLPADMAPGVATVPSSAPQGPKSINTLSAPIAGATGQNSQGDERE